jgi:hypothetical protein
MINEASYIDEYMTWLLLTGHICSELGGVWAGEENALILMIGVPAFINSINRSCFRASMRNRWLPINSLSGDRRIRSRLGFCDIVSDVVFHIAGRRVWKVLSFGALDSADANAQIVESADSRNITFTDSYLSVSTNSREASVTITHEWIPVRNSLRKLRDDIFGFLLGKISIFPDDQMLDSFHSPERVSKSWSRALPQRIFI